MDPIDSGSRELPAEPVLHSNAVDAHVHFWKYDPQRYGWIDGSMKILQQDYLPEHLALHAKRNQVDGCVAVQADSSELETHFLVELAKTHPFILGVVGWVDLLAPTLEERLDYFSAFSQIKGYRHIAQSEPNDFLKRKDFQRAVRSVGRRGYTYDILVYHHQLPAAVEFAAALPDQRLIIDHLAKPDVRQGQLDGWEAPMRRLGAMPNVYCKLSGLFTEAAWKQWSPKDFYPYLDVAFQAFGPSRLCFGSDWPVMLLSGMYVQWKSLLEKYMEAFSVEERQNVFRENAFRFYQL